MTKYNWSSYFQGGMFRKGGRSLTDPISLKKSAKSQYHSVIKSDYEEYYDEHHDDDDQYHVHSKNKSSSSSFNKKTSTTNTTTTTAVSSSSSGINNNNNVREDELEWKLVIFVCDDYEEEPKRYDVPLRYISSSPVFRALVSNSGHELGAIISQGWLVLPCSIRLFESIHNLAMCQAEEEKEEEEKARRRRSI